MQLTEDLSMGEANFGNIGGVLNGGGTDPASKIATLKTEVRQQQSSTCIVE